LWGTTPAFLSQFGLQQLRDLPRREDLLVEPAALPMDAPPSPAEAEEPESDAEAGEPAP